MQKLAISPRSSAPSSARSSVRFFSSLFSTPLTVLTVGILGTSLLLTSAAEAAPSVKPANKSPSGLIAFSCSAKEGGAGFDLEISSTGDAKAKLNQNGKSYSCPLAISKFTDRRKAKVPFVGVTLARKNACSPALPQAFSKTLKGNFALNLVKSGRKPASNVSFLTSKDEATCAPTNFRVADFNALIKKWNGKRN